MASLNVVFPNPVLGVLFLILSALISAAPSASADTPLQACTEVAGCTNDYLSVWYRGTNDFFCCPNNADYPVCDSWYPPSKCVCPPAYNASCSACWSLQVGPWSGCSATCGGGVSLRSVRCTTDGNITDLPIAMCGDPLVYVNSTQCNTFACTPPAPAPGYVWYADPWQPCDTFNGCVNYRQVYCLDAETYAKVDITLCDATTQPANNQSCGGQCVAPTRTCGGLPAQNATDSQQYVPHSEPSWTGMYMVSNASDVTQCDPTQCCCPSSTTGVNVLPTDNSITFTTSSSGANCSQNEYIFQTSTPRYPVTNYNFGGYSFVLQHDSNRSTLTAIPTQAPGQGAAAPAVCGFTLVRTGPPIFPDDDSGLTSGQKIGIIVGSIGAGLLLGGLIFCWMRRKRIVKAGEQQRLLKSTMTV